MAKIIISKLDAARRQLETATLLYFNNRDGLSIHTLAAAAYEIVGTIAQKSGRSTLVQRSLLDLIPTDLAEKVRKAIRTPQNFLKHADRDPEAQLEFDPDFTELILLDAIITYAQITGEIPSTFKAFLNWVAIQRPEIVGSEAGKQMGLWAKRQLGPISRMEFFEMALSADASIKPQRS